MMDSATFTQSVEIIIVDDRRENLIAMQAALADPLYRLTCLSSGEQLLQYLKNADTRELAAILLDVQMPGMDGFETAKLIKSRKALLSIPIVFLTAINKTEAYMEKGYQSGAIDYIFKPINSDILRHKIKAFVQIHQIQKELERANELLRCKTDELEMNNVKLIAAEYQLSRTNRELESKIEERAQSLKQAFQEIRESHLLFRSVFSMSPCLLAIRCLKEGTYLDINETWESVTGYTLDEMQQFEKDGLSFIQTEDVPGFSHPNANVNNAKVTFHAKNGGTRCGLLSKQLIELNGAFRQLIVILDVTEQEQWEIQSARLERLHLIGEMAAAIAHEVRNPMTTVKGFLQLCKKKNNLLNEEYIDLMLQELSRANGIITEFLTLAKNKSTDLQTCSLNAAISSILPLLEAEALIGGKQVFADFGVVPALQLDEKEIRQLILNIAMNGLDSMEEGGVLLIRTIHIHEEQQVVLQISDEGGGIPDEVMHRLGTPFLTTKENGTGLGLAVCYSIASRHKAVIDVKTGREGSDFLIRFPA
jgi:two-component system, sporulation sensor kinase E